MKECRDCASWALLWDAHGRLLDDCAVLPRDVAQAAAEAIEELAGRYGDEARRLAGFDRDGARLASDESIRLDALADRLRATVTNHHEEKAR